MNPTPLRDDSGKIQAYVCSECLHIYGENVMDVSVKCCTCIYCNEKVPYHNVRNSWHDSCRDKWEIQFREKQFEKAEKVTGYDSYIYDPNGSGQDGYWQSMEEFCEYLLDNFSEEDLQDYPDEWPKFVFCCTEEYFKISANHLIESAIEEHYEDAYEQIKGFKELDAAVIAFNKTNEHIVSFNLDYKRAVAVPTLAELRKEQSA